MRSGLRSIYLETTARFPARVLNPLLDARVSSGATKVFVNVSPTCIGRVIVIIQAPPCRARAGFEHNHRGNEPEPPKFPQIFFIILFLLCG